MLISSVFSRKKMFFKQKSLYEMLFKAKLLVSLFILQVQSQTNCKNPHVFEKDDFPNDVRNYSPFYVIALPKTPETQEMDNICYTYFEDPKDEAFFHIISVTYINGTHTSLLFSKHGIPDMVGIVEGKSKTDECVYHDYSLEPICNNGVFILYRCYIEEKCSHIDIGPIKGVDVRVFLAANQNISSECLAETQSSMSDTSTLNGDDYIILPQKQTPNCITEHNGLVSFDVKRALGPKKNDESSVCTVE